MENKEKRIEALANRSANIRNISLDEKNSMYIRMKANLLWFKILQRINDIIVGK